MAELPEKQSNPKYEYLRKKAASKKNRPALIGSYSPEDNNQKADDYIMFFPLVATI